MKVFFTTDERYQLKKSFYSHKISTSNSSVSASQYLHITVDAEQKSLLEQQIKVKQETRWEAGWPAPSTKRSLIKLCLCCCLHCPQDCKSKVRDIGERLKALDQDVVGLNRRDNELLAEKKTLCELKGKKRQLEQKISTKQDRWGFCVKWTTFSAGTICDKQLTMQQSSFSKIGIHHCVWSWYWFDVLIQNDFANKGNIVL